MFVLRIVYKSSGNSHYDSTSDRANLLPQWNFNLNYMYHICKMLQDLVDKILVFVQSRFHP
jgi:hypothetical protein